LTPFNAKEPHVSVVIRTYRRPMSLNTTLESLTKLEYDKTKLEILVTKSSGDLGVDEVVTNFVHEFGDSFRLTVITIEENSATKAWNAGIKASRGALVMVLPDDVHVHPLTLTRAVGHLTGNGKLAAVTYPAVPEGFNGTNRPSLLYRLHQLRFDQTVTTVRAVSVVTVYRRDYLTLVGLYREDMGPPLSIHEDWELGSRICRHGYKILIDGTLRQVHSVPVEVSSQENKSKNESQSKNQSNALYVLKSYSSAYMRRDASSFWEVLKSSPIEQILEYLGYALVPLTILLLVTTNVLFAFFFLVALFLVAATTALVKGYYRLFGWWERLAYPFVILSIRVFRTILAFAFVVLKARNFINFRRVFGRRVSDEKPRLSGAPGSS